jgi:hypothetical protein
MEPETRKALDELEEVEWFRAVGQPLADDWPLDRHTLVQVHSWDEALTHSKVKKWYDICYW